MLTHKHIVIIVGACALTLFGTAVHFDLFRAALVVNTNTQAINAQNKLNNTTNSLNAVFERISAGLRINKAADDASGLGVSESMDATMRSLQQALRNTADGVSLLQTAEGSANEVGNIIKRMRELAVQAASETLATDEREYIEDEDEDPWTELYAAGDDLTIATDSLEFGGIVSGTADGTTPSYVILSAQQRYAAQLATIAGAIDEALLDDDAETLITVLDAADRALASARKEAVRAAEAVAKEGEKTAKATERAQLERERKAAGGARSTTKSQKSPQRSAKSASKASATRR